MRLMSIPSLTAITLCTLSTLSILPPASAQANHGDSRDVIFAGLAMQDGSSDNTICTARYGDGYMVTPSKEAPTRIFTSDKGHTVTLVDRSEIMGQGIYAEHDRFLMTFPNEGDAKIEVTQFVTGLTGAHSYSGVFTVRIPEHPATDSGTSGHPLFGGCEA
ncbi:hypothetical protein [Pseudovibrio sp. Tun.PSC04-5.I4]|uniref:hypothetical protein n=1 Tax=Pseudovibrio sp. Tun.PSC04-5.I4 TaxID=1798213 RepID=UPI000888CAE1|nr:hypothetical protein [Pseudovibrio sp. Tun.PSC04-5.I4]SDR06895.1 hypothetical protein SAMN04515695_2592 [Pseudovibrio sp. Tun.PSC04-5.I4]